MSCRHACPFKQKGTNVALHPGAFFLGTGERPYYRPITMVQQALDAGRPLIFVSMQYRLGALGFFHTPEASDIVPANNGLHDQRIGKLLKMQPSDCNVFAGETDLADLLCVL